MNSFDEHLFDEEMKLFKFTNEKEKKETEPSQQFQSTQEMIFPDQTLLDSNNNTDTSFSLDSNKNEDNKSILENSQQQIILDQKNKNEKSSRNQKRNKTRQNTQKQFFQQQTLMAPQQFQPNFNYSQHQFLSSSNSNQFIKNMSNRNFNNLMIQNTPFSQQQIMPNSNFIGINSNRNIPFSPNSLPNQKNGENIQKMHRQRRKTTPKSEKNNSDLKVDSNTNYSIPPQNADPSSNINNITPINNAYFHPTVPPDIDHFNINRNVDSNLINYIANNNTDEDALFKDALENANMRFNPVKLGFIPSSFWSDNEMTFNEIVKSFFQRKNNSKCRFPHKLYNALIFTSKDPSLFPLVGVYWVDQKSILIRRKTFARLLGIKSIEGSLFHQQGNFPSHGFLEIDPKIVKMRFPNFDFSINRLITHKTGAFVYGCTEADIDECKWNSASK